MAKLDMTRLEKSVAAAKRALVAKAAHRGQRPYYRGGKLVRGHGEQDGVNTSPQKARGAVSHPLAGMQGATQYTQAGRRVVGIDAGALDADGDIEKGSRKVHRHMLKQGYELMEENEFRKEPARENKWLRALPKEEIPILLSHGTDVQYYASYRKKQ